MAKTPAVAGCRPVFGQPRLSPAGRRAAARPVGGNAGEDSGAARIYRVLQPAPQPAQLGGLGTDNRQARRAGEPHGQVPARPRPARRRGRDHRRLQTFGLGPRTHVSCRRQPLALARHAGEFLHDQHLSATPQPEPGRLEGTGGCVPRMGTKGGKDIHRVRTHPVQAETQDHRTRTPHHRARSFLQGHTRSRQPPAARHRIHLQKHVRQPSVRQLRQLGGPGGAHHGHRLLPGPAGRPGGAGRSRL